MYFYLIPSSAEVKYSTVACHILKLITFMYLSPKANSLKIKFHTPHRYFIINYYFSDYLFRMPENLIEKGLNLLTAIAIQNKDKDVKFAAYRSVARFRKKYDEGKDQDRLMVVKSMLDEIYRSESNERLKELYRTGF